MFILLIAFINDKVLYLLTDNNNLLLILFTFVHIYSDAPDRFLTINHYTVTITSYLFFRCCANYHSEGLEIQKWESSKKKPKLWPVPFPIPEPWPPLVQNELAKAERLSKKPRMTVIRILYEEILKYTQ